MPKALSYVLGGKMSDDLSMKLRYAAVAVVSSVPFITFLYVVKYHPCFLDAWQGIIAGIISLAVSVGLSAFLCIRFGAWIRGEKED